MFQVIFIDDNTWYFFLMTTLVLMSAIGQCLQFEMFHVIFELTTTLNICFPVLMNVIGRCVMQFEVVGDCEFVLFLMTSFVSVCRKSWLSVSNCLGVIWHVFSNSQHNLWILA